MVAFIVNTISTFSTSAKADLLKGLGESRGGIFSTALPVHHCLAVISARAKKMDFEVFALQGKLVIQRRGCATPQQMVHSDPKKGNTWITGLPVSKANTLAATMRVTSH